MRKREGKRKEERGKEGEINGYAAPRYGQGSEFELKGQVEL